jgi:hypothetical protein
MREQTNTTKAYLRHAMVGTGLSGQRRFVPRASTAVNNEIVPPGTKMAAATAIA